MTERSLDTVLQLVADRHRRQTIHHLRHEANGKATIDEVVDRLHNGRSDADGQTIDREQLAVQLCHAHLPKLADHGVVEFDPENRTVRYRPDDQFETILDVLPDEQPLASP
ncbi:DUF7344 domain-containing protein [Halobellus salinisoli]|uniref:DUF7344 domain-containing protein n=1 Tax=Halobellus salinisoli TaxID=3108500 RepID=UPI003CE4F381